MKKILLFVLLALVSVSRASTQVSVVGDSVTKVVVNTAATSAVTVWTPATGNSVFLTSLVVCSVTAGSVVVFDSGGNTVAAVLLSANACSPEIRWNTPKKLAAANNTLTITGPGNVSVIAKGFEQ